jgi:pectinesterase
MSHSTNQVILQAGISSAQTGTADASASMSIHNDNFKMYNVNVENTFGHVSQAVAFSQYGSRVGSYACGFYGYQDILHANQGTRVYLRNYIEVESTCVFNLPCIR